MSEARALSGDHSTEGHPHTEAAGMQAVAIERSKYSILMRARRVILLIGIPVLAALLAALAYLSAGRYVSTENAYVKAHIVNISAEVSGTIIEVPVEENQTVAAGDVLFFLDRRPFELARDRASAMLAKVESDLAADKLAYRRALSEVALHQTTERYSRAQLSRQEGLVNANLGREEDLDTAYYNLNTAQRQVAIAEESAETLLARLNGSPDGPATSFPAWQAARAELDQALFDLDKAVARAPFSGIVTNRPEPGDYVNRGVPITSIVSSEAMWIEANFKETQMTNIHEGQSVTVKVDTYPDRLWQGRIRSISRSTGAEFALLPPQNATGNWVKIVQRVPVRIDILAYPEDLPLRAGMSCEVSVDTGYERSWHDLLPSW